MPDSLNREELNDWYEQHVGYRPDDDNGAPLPLEEIRQTIREWLAEADCA